MSDARNPNAYEASIRRNIKINASKTRSAAWLAQDDHQTLWVYLYGCRDFTDSPLCDGMFAGDFGAFMLKLRNDLDEWGQLTDRQADVVRRSLERARERIARREQAKVERRERDSRSTHVGTVGERRDWVLTVERVLSFDSQFGMVYIHLCRDADGNVIVYKGGNRWEGDTPMTVRVKATVKAHDERDGIAQTMISRPKLIA